MGYLGLGYRPVILLVEDEFLIAVTMQAELGALGEVLLARTLDQARQLFTERTPDVVVLDGDLGQDRNRKRVTSLPLIAEFTGCGHIISITAHDDLRVEMLSAGCHLHCSKIGVGHALLERLLATA